MMLLVLLLLVFLLSAGLYRFITVNQNVLGYNDGRARVYFIGYAWLVCVLLAGLGAAAHLGVFNTFGSPAIDDLKERRLEHHGYYVAADGAFRFSGTATDEGFQHDAFGPDEFLTLTPHVERPDQRPGQAGLRTWTMASNATSLPLRFDGHCVNLPAAAWMGSGSVLTVVDATREPAPFVSVRWQEDATWLGARTNAYLFSSGYRLPNGQDSTVYDGVLLTDRVYKESRELATMLRRAPSAFTAQVRIDPAWLEMAQGITLVRRHLGDVESPMGVLVTRRFYEDDEGRPRGYVAELGGAALTYARPSGVSDTTVTAGTQITYGFTGYRNLLALDALSDTLMLDERNGYVVPLSFKRKESWALPHEKEGDAWQLKSPFIVTSSSAYAELPSYVINTVGQAFPFYVKVSVPDADEAHVLHINDGRRNTLIGLDEIVSLGGTAHGALLAYRPARAPKLRVLGIPLTAHVGFWAIFFLVLSTIGFHVLLRLEAGWCQRLKLDLAFALVWAMVLTILVVRLILAYRIALLPPENATAGEIAFVFHKSFVASFWALAVLPPALLAMRLLFMARWNLADRLTRTGSSGPLGGLAAKLKTASVSLGERVPARLREAGLLAAVGRHWMLWLPPWLWIGLGAVFGANESLFGIRISIGLHLLLVIGLFFSFTKIIRDDKPREAWLVFILAGVAVVGCMVVIKDYGFFVYGFSFLLCFAMFALRHYTLGTRDEFNRFRMTRTWGVLALIILIPVAISMIPRLGGLADFVGEIDPQGNVFYRITSYNDTEEAVLLGTGDEREYSPVQLLRNSYQNWQMMLYAAEGSVRPHGYGGAVLSDAGMTYPTSITDTAFAVYLLAEHGALVSILFLLLYLGLCFACMYGGWLLAQKDLARTLILFLIGAYFACNALYMAAANLGLVFFTGQNIPLLGLYSGADVLQAMVLLMIVTALLHKDVEQEGSGSVEMTMAEHRGMWTAQRWFLRVLGVLVLLLLVRMWTLPDRYLKDHNFSKALFRVVSDRDWVYDAGTGQITVAVENDNLGPLRRIEEIYRQQFNNRLDKTAENGGLYYVIPIEDRGRVVRHEVRVNRFLFTLVSPFKDRALWRGTVLARGDEALPTLSTLGTEFQVRLDTLGLPATIRFAQTPGDEVAGSALKLVDRRRQSIFELEREGNDIILEDAGNNWAVYRNGAPIQGRVRLVKHDIIAVMGDDGQQQAFLFLGMQPPILGATEWRNGRWQYVYPGGHEFPAVYTLMEAGRHAHLLAVADDSVPAPGDTLNLSLDIRLHRDLQAAMTAYARQNPTYRAGDPLRTNRLAFTVVDAFTGEVLALPAWPTPDPNAPEFDELLRTASPTRQLRLLQNHNFRRHVIGSTTKPVLFTSVASALWDEDAAAPVDLATMSVLARGEPGRVVLGKPMKLAHDSLGGLPLGSSWDSDRNNNGQVIDARSFFYQSLNYYMGTVGMIGMMPDRAYFDDVLPPVSPTSPYRDVFYDGRWRRLDMKRLPPGQTPFTIEDLPRAPRILNVRVRNTLLWQGLRENYDVLISGVDVGASREALRDSALVRTAGRFLPLFDQGRASTQNRFLNEAMPDPMVLDPRQWDGFLREDLISFFLGGGINLWSNVAMAEAGARLATGRRVEARLERRAADPDFDDMPLPLRDSTWRNTRILSPMQDAGRVTGLGQGTAQVIFARVQAQLRQRGINPARYRIVFKTGTLQEREPNDPRSEMLLCIVGEWEGTEEAGRFMPGRTLSSFLYMQESRAAGTYHRNDLAPPLIVNMILHLEQTREEALRRAKAAGVAPVLTASPN